MINTIADPSEIKGPGLALLQIRSLPAMTQHPGWADVYLPYLKRRRDEAHDAALRGSNLTAVDREVARQKFLLMEELIAWPAQTVNTARQTLAAGGYGPDGDVMENQ